MDMGKFCPAVMGTEVRRLICFLLVFFISSLHGVRAQNNNTTAHPTSNITKSLPVNIPAQRDGGTWKTPFIVSVVLAVALFTVSIWLYRKYNHLKKLNQLLLYKVSESCNVEMKENPFVIYDESYVVSWEDFEIEETIHDHGFHKICKGTMRNMPIVIKTLQDECGLEFMRSDLLTEINQLIYLGKHEHIVEFKGACTQFLREGRVYTLLEYCPLGDLQTFLDNNSSKFCSNSNIHYIIDTANPSGINDGNDDTTRALEFTRSHLTQWCIQIAKGLHYLETKRVIPLDVAIRNVLMKSINHVKLCSFGGSIHLPDDEDSHLLAQKRPLPWRQMAVETLQYFKFTTKSTVWSFGVVMWQIFSLGKVPYAPLTWTAEFVDKLEDTFRLSKPEDATDNVYQLMTNCWDTQPEKRPTFEELEAGLLKTVREDCTKTGGLETEEL